MSWGVCKAKATLEYNSETLFILFPPQPLTPNLHAAEGEPFLAQVLQRGADMIDGVVDAACSKMELTEKRQSTIDS